MEPKLLSNETLIKSIEVGARTFIFTDKRLIVQTTNGQDSRYSSFDNISRPVVTTEVLTDPTGPKFKLFSVAIWVVFLVFYGFYVDDTYDGMASVTIAFFISAPFAFLLGFVLTQILKKKPKEVLLFQLLMKDGTMLVNEYYDIETKASLTEVEYLIVEHTLN